MKAWKLFGLMSALVIILLVGCGKSPQSEQQRLDSAVTVNQGQAGPLEYKESPFTEEKVKSGQLPQLKERLPNEPLIVDKNYFTPGTIDNWQPGKFGGDLRVSHNEPNAAPDVYFMVMQPIIRLSNGLSDGDIQDNICHFLGASSDNKVFTFKIREGLKWSDGTPVTTEDVRFAYEDVTMNKDLNPSVPSWLALEGKAGELTIVDQYTFRFSFEKEYGAFIRNVMINRWVEYSRIIKPSHYLKQFHIKYSSADDIKKHIQDARLGDNATWLQLFLQMDAYDRNINSRSAIKMPVLNPWYLASVENEVFIYERNPYYYKVDITGQQLPYIDRIVSPKVQDGEMENMRMISGEADILRRNSALVKLPLYKDNESQGRYTTLILNSHLDAPSTLYFNYFYPDENIRAIINDVRFRTALSLAINKQEIIDSVYLGFGSIPTYTRGEFNPGEGNRLLDEMGMKIGPDGFRLSPDGKPFVFLIEGTGDPADLGSSSEIMAAHLRENLKLNSTMKKTDTSLFGQAILSNQVMTHMVWAFDHTLEDEYTTRNVTEPTAVMRDYIGGSITVDNKRIDPPDYLKELFRLYEQRMQFTYGTPEYDAHIQREKDFYYKNVLAIPLIEKSVLPLPISNRLGNTPTGGYQITSLMTSEHLYVK